MPDIKIGVIGGSGLYKMEDLTEVEEIQLVPLAELLLEEVFREEEWAVGGSSRSMHFFELVGDTVWGATAAMLRQLLMIAAGIDDGTVEPLDVE